MSISSPNARYSGSAVCRQRTAVEQRIRSGLMRWSAADCAVSSASAKPISSSARSKSLWPGRAQPDRAWRRSRSWKAGTTLSCMYSPGVGNPQDGGVRRCRRLETPCGCSVVPPVGVKIKPRFAVFDPAGPLNRRPSRTKCRNPKRRRARPWNVKRLAPWAVSGVSALKTLRVIVMKY